MLKPTAGCWIFIGNFGQFRQFSLYGRREKTLATRFATTALQRRARKKRFLPFVLLALVAFGGIYLQPKNHPLPSGRSFVRGLTVHLDHSSPAFAAFEDSHLPTAADATESRDELLAGTPHSTLAAGRSSIEPTLRKIAAETEFERKQAVAAREINEAREVAPSARTIKTVTQNVSLSQLNVSREELLRGLLVPMVQSAKAARKPAAIWFPGAPRPVTVAAVAPASPRLPNDMHAEAVVPKPGGNPAAPINTVDSSSSGVHQVVISGAVEFSNGLALTSASEKIAVFREQDGEAVEAGVVWPKQGRYEIFVEEAQGALVGELRSAGGEAIGRGEIDFAKMQMSSVVDQHKIENITLKLSPLPRGMSGRVLTNADRAFVKSAHVKFVQLNNLANQTMSLDQGKFESPEFLEGSTALVRLEKEKHLPSLSMVATGDSNDLTLFSNKALAPLLTIASAMNKAKHKDEASGIIWGRVTVNGISVLGAHVELSTSQSSPRAVYFNEKMEPDLRLTSTSPNGVYAFVGVSMGTHAVEVTYDHVTTDPLIVPTDIETVSRADVEMSKSVPAKLKVFDAFRAEWPLAAEVMPLGGAQPFEVSRDGVTKISYAKSSGFLILDTDAGRSYDVTRITSGRNRHVLNVPMIQTAWLDQIRTRAQIPRDASAGTVVGFIQGTEAYRVSIDEQALHQGARVIYFTPQGELSQYDYGQPGGGFALLNAPEGFRTIAVQPSGSQKAFTSVQLVERRVTNVLTQWLK
jgi:hypothetical protein